MVSTARKFFVVFLIIFPVFLAAQPGYYWSNNFNEVSSLLSGAVVGGGAGPSSIYYNPAGISEITESKLSINASLIFVEFTQAKNAWGEGLDFKDTRIYVIPRFVSYMLKHKNNPKWNFQFAILNNSNLKVEHINFTTQKLDILTHLPGEEKYIALSAYKRKYRDDWVGAGGSYQLNEKFSMGISMFLSAKSNFYEYNLDIEAGPTQDIIEEPAETPFFTAKYNEEELMKFNDYRFLWKLGFLYNTDLFSAGLNITTPSLGGIYSDGKRIYRKRGQSNITNPETGEPIPNYLIMDYKEKKEVHVNAKSPLSVAAGLRIFNSKKTKSFYLTLEYFTKINPYRMVQTQEDLSNLTPPPFEALNGEEWLTFTGGAKHIFNAAIGFRWNIDENLIFLSGLRTDFNVKKNYDFMPFDASKAVKTFDIDKYHLTSGLSFRVLRHDIIAGLQYTFGLEENQQQFANLSDPVEFNFEELKALQGTRNFTMKSILNSLSIYFGATFNF